ncbi:berberine bridge enzyme-like 22 [Nicotiana tomentosiformis]|uniref:berberine bridge enzyme-like 22 n=1 Tax=Nicotiana tomentosiformis TaxID=4098 RepID=UPI00051B2639|nr:berberine bridge enzyme-like 22 [Nicotiana tomentosiformis]
MGRLQLFSCLLVSFLLLIEANAQQEFLQCIYSHSSENIKKHIHFPNSPTYSSLLEYAQKNPRWLNSSFAHPIFIIAPKNESEIQPIILCSQKFGLQIRVKSGGHDYEGLSFRSVTNTQFVILDLINLDDIRIDKNEETAWIQTGVTMGQLYYEIAKKSKILAFPGGLYPSVGSGGLISGGGIGTLMRKFGLSADNIIDARVMDVNGRILDKKSMGEDMFWAIRGGGGSSFGVILAWKIKLVRIPPKVTVFTVRRKLEGNTINLLQRWQNVSHKFPKDLFMRVLIQNMGFGNEKIVQVSFQGLFLGRASELTPLLNQTFPEFGLDPKNCFQDPVVNCNELPFIKKECFEVPWIRSTLYFASKRTNNSIEFLVNNTVSQTKNYQKATSDFVKTPMQEEVWGMIKDLFLEEEKPMIILDPLGGKLDEISESELPFPHRKGNLFNIQYMVNWGDNSESISSKKIKWLRELYEKMKPFLSHCPRTAYLNYRDLDFGTNDGVYRYSKAKVWGAKYFNENFERLAKVKSKVDPGNFFRYEQSIPPFSVST